MKLKIINMADLVILNVDQVSVIYFNDKEQLIEYQMNNTNNTKIIEQKINNREKYLEQKDNLKTAFRKSIGIGE